MINKGILNERLVEKFKNLALQGIVLECFMNAIPMNISEYSREEKAGVMGYSKSVVSTLGGYSLVTEALSSLKDERRKDLVQEIDQICMEAAKEAAKRVTADADCKDGNLDKIVTDAKFTDAEYQKFAKNVDSIKPEEISQAIQEKTINVIKTEQDAWNNEAELTSQLNQTVQDNTADGATTESFVNMVVGKFNPRRHVSLFSTLQDVAIGSISSSRAETADEACLESLTDITFQLFIDSLRKEDDSLKTCLESLIDAESRVESECKYEKNDLFDAAMASSTLIYTAMETLKTLNLYSPSREAIEGFISKTQTNADVLEMRKASAFTRATEMLENLDATTFTEKPSATLSDTLNELTEIKGYMQMLVTNSNHGTSVRPELLNGLDNIIDRLNGLLDQRRSEATKAEEGFTFYEKRNREADISHFNRVNTLYGKTPVSGSIIFDVNPTGSAKQVIDVRFANESNTQTSWIKLDAKLKDNESIMDYVIESIGKSSLVKSNKSIIVRNATGTGQEIVVK